MTEPQPGDYVRVDPPQGSPCSVTGASLWGTFLHAEEGSAAVMCEDGGDSAVALGELVIVPLEWLSPAVRPVRPETGLDDYMGLPMEDRGLDELILGARGGAHSPEEGITRWPGVIAAK